MSVQQKVATRKVFDQQGVLRMPGEVFAFDTNAKKSPAKKGEKRDKGIADVGTAKVPSPAVIAAIAPAGPNPTQPQTLPSGSNQTIGGYTGPQGEQLLAEGGGGVQVEEGGASVLTEPSALDGSIDDLKTHLSTVNDAAELDQLRAAETAGKSRAGALKAIDDRKAELDAAGASPLS